MTATGEEGREAPADTDGMSLTKLLRPLSDRAESVRPFVPWIGGPRLYALVLYAAVIIGAGVEFFANWETWYGNWEVYNTYLFAVSGLFLVFGLLMLFDVQRMTLGKPGRILLPLPKSIVGQAGFVLVIASLAGLAVSGPSVGGWAVVMSVLAVLGFLMMVVASKAIDDTDSLYVMLYGLGIVLLLLVPVLEAYDVVQSDPYEYPFSAVNLPLIVLGTAFAFLALKLMRTRDGMFGAWLIGAMSIFLVTFHEQVGILPSGGIDQYDRTLATIGIVFSLVPLTMYLAREMVYNSMWTRLKKANAAVRKGSFAFALKQADEALEMSFDAGIARRFALPWSLKGDALYGLKEQARAKTHYDIALEIDPDDSTSWCQIGNIYAFDAKRALALSAYDRALRIDERNGYAWNNKGVIYSSLAWPEEALVCFNKAMVLMPGNFDARINMAKMTSRLGRHDEAVMHYRDALKIKPKSEVAVRGLQREFVRGQRIDQIRGWEQMGLDATYLWRLLREDPANFEKRTKEFLSSIVEQKTQLTIAAGKEKFNINEAIKTILRITEQSGATLEKIEKETGFPKDVLVLPMALLMKTDRLHFSQFGDRDIFVSRGKAPEEPTIEPVETVVEAEPAEAEPADGPASEEEQEPPEQPTEEEEPEAVEERKDPKTKQKEEDMEPTASVLVFSGRPRKRERRDKSKKKSRKKGTK
jgi:tetratricopeptide (TPR) repeat protein